MDASTQTWVYWALTAALALPPVLVWHQAQVRSIAPPRVKVLMAWLLPAVAMGVAAGSVHVERSKIDPNLLGLAASAVANDYDGRFAAPGRATLQRALEEQLGREVEVKDGPEDAERDIQTVKARLVDDHDQVECIEIEGERIGGGSLLTVTDRYYRVSTSYGDCTW